MADTEKNTADLSIPQQPPRAFTAPGRTVDPNNFARSLSSAELGPVVDSTNDGHITEKTYVDEPRPSSLLPGGNNEIEDLEAGGAGVEGGGAGVLRSGSAPERVGSRQNSHGDVGAAEQIGALRQRRPAKGVRSESAPAAARTQSKDVEPAQGIVRNATKVFAGMLEPKVRSSSFSEFSSRGGKVL
jgi:hypothetical protein